jgi:hypothetical protein
MISGQSVENVANPMPVTAIEAAAATSKRRSAKRCPHRPTASVARAEPNSVTVLRKPTSKLP